jgi:TIR domain
MPRYDVFIAYAGPNAPHARELYEALAATLGKDRVFFDQEQPPGVSWYREIQTALVDSRVTAAVLAREPNGGWFDKDEIILAIDEVRKGDHVLIPVFADGTPERMRDWPYGLKGLTAIDARARGGMAAAAEAIVERLRELPASGVPGPPHPRTRRELLEAALHLDRADQWGAIQKIAHGGDDAYFLLYGQTFQNLRLFLERIVHRLGEEMRPHCVLELPYRFGGLYAANVAEWDQRLVAALRSWLSRADGRVEDLMAAAARQQPLFLILELRWNQRFEAPHQAALRAFLEQRLPELSRSSGGLGTRLLVAAEYFDREQSRHHDVAAWMRAAKERGVVRYEPMAELETPRRVDVVAFLERCGFVPGDPEYGEILRGYDQIAEDPRLDFDRLSAFLDRQLHEPAAAEGDAEDGEGGYE